MARRSWHSDSAALGSLDGGGTAPAAGRRPTAYRPCGYDMLPGIGLGLRLWRGRFENLDATWLRWQSASGEPVPTGGERADQLAALLRAHGISPDSGATD